MCNYGFTASHFEWLIQFRASIPEIEVEIEQHEFLSI